MNARLRIWSISWLALVLVSIPAIDARSVGDLVKAGSFDNESVKAGSFDNDVVPLAVVDGFCDWVLPTHSLPCHLIVGSLGMPGQTFPVTLRVEATQTEVRLPLETSRDDRAGLQELARQAERCRRLRQVPEPLPPRIEPPRRKTFYIFTGDRDLENAGSYSQIAADICKVGKFVQVYLDIRDPRTAELDEAVSDLIRTFDDEVYPFARKNLGQAADVDRDGRFSVLFSGMLGRLQGGKVSLDGFVRGSDFLADVAAPFSNRCDMLYMNTRLKAGPHLRTVLSHEYTHAVAFSEHVLHNPPDCRKAEESWLNEGLAHLVEDMHQHGWSNLDHRVRAFLAQTHSFPLVVPDYFGTGLWRNPGTRGSAFLFLRWCQVRCGGDLPRRLIQSPFVGVRNLENAMQEPFASLFRAWAVSMIRDDSWRKDVALPGCIIRAEKEPALGPALRGPSIQTLEGGQEFVLAASSFKYFLVPAGGDSNQRYRVQAAKEAGLQVTLVPIRKEPHTK